MHRFVEQFLNFQLVFQLLYLHPRCIHIPFEAVPLLSRAYMSLSPGSSTSIRFYSSPRLSASFVRGVSLFMSRLKLSDSVLTISSEALLFILSRTWVFCRTATTLLLVTVPVTGLEQVMSGLTTKCYMDCASCHLCISSMFHRAALHSLVHSHEQLTTSTVWGYFLEKEIKYSILHKASSELNVLSKN